MNDHVTCTLDDLGIADVRLVRTDRMNALDGAMFDALLATIERLKRERGLRAVVIAGDGRAFCAGIDLGRLQTLATGKVDGVLSAADAAPRTRLIDRTHGLANRAQQVAFGWRDVPVPVIAAVHGVAFGGGLQVALGADVRIAAPDTKLSVMELAWGLVPDMAGFALLRELVRGDVMRELVLSARVLLAPEAQSLGLVTQVSDAPLTAARALATTIAGYSPHAVRAAKRLLNQSLSGASTGAVLLAEATEQQALIGSANQREAVQARLAKRAARFSEPE